MHNHFSSLDLLWYNMRLFRMYSVNFHVFFEIQISAFPDYWILFSLNMKLKWYRFEFNCASSIFVGYCEVSREWLCIYFQTQILLRTMLKEACKFCTFLNFFFYFTFRNAFWDKLFGDKDSRSSLETLTLKCFGFHLFCGGKQQINPKHLEIKCV